MKFTSLVLLIVVLTLSCSDRPLDSTQATKNTQKIADSPISDVGMLTIKEVQPVTNKELRTLMGSEDGCKKPSSFRMEVDGALVPHLRLLLLRRLGSLPSDIGNRFGLSGQSDYGAFHVCGPLCQMNVWGYINFNYATWCPGAEFIFTGRTNFAGVLINSIPDSPLVFKMTEQGLVYLAGTGTVRFEAGKQIDLNPEGGSDKWAALLANTSPLVRQGAAIMSGRKKLLDSVPGLITLMADSEMALRRDAALALGEIGDQRAVSTLTSALHDKSNKVAVAAITALAQIKTPAALHALLGIVFNSEKGKDAPSKELQDAAYKAFDIAANLQVALEFEGKFEPLSISDESRSMLTKMLKSSDLLLLSKAGHIAGMTGDIVFIDPLVELLTRSDIPSSGSVIVSYAFLGEAKSVPVLQMIANDKSRATFDRSVAVWMASRFAGESSVEVAQSYLDEPELLVMAARGLGQSANPKAAAKLLTMMKASSNQKIQSFIAQDITFLGKNARSELIELVRDSRPNIRFSVISGFKRTQDLTLAVKLIPLLKDSYFQIREIVAKTLNSLGWKPENNANRMAFLFASGRYEEVEGDSEVLLTLIPADDLWNLGWTRNARIGAASILGKSESHLATATLLRLLNDRDDEVRKAAALALEQIDWKPANDEERALSLIGLKKWAELRALGSVGVSNLLAILKRDISSRPWITSQLAAFGEEAVPLLIKHILSDHKSSRAWAADALVKIGAPAESKLKALEDSSSNKEILKIVRATLLQIQQPAPITPPGTKI